MIQGTGWHTNSETMVAMPYKAGAVMLLLCYLAVFVYSPVGVPHFHQEEDMHQGSSCETDACHITIYHPGSEGGCTHKSHFSPAIHKCDFCNLFLPRQIVPPLAGYTAILVEFSFAFFPDSTEGARQAIIEQANRGPPSLI